MADTNRKGTAFFNRKVSLGHYNMLEVGVTEEYNPDEESADIALKKLGVKVDAFLKESGLLANTSLVTVKEDA